MGKAVLKKTHCGSMEFESWIKRGKAALDVLT